MTRLLFAFLVLVPSLACNAGEGAISDSEKMLKQARVYEEMGTRAAIRSAGFLYKEIGIN